jgi:phosphoribosylanthranilate isomerase
MRVKICGITSPEHILVSAAAGADYIGLVCAPSRRQVTTAQAQRLVATLRDAGYLTPIVGLFVNESPDVVARTVVDVGIDILQLHGSEPFEQLDALPVMPIWRAVRLQGAPAEEQWLARSFPQVTLLVDAFVPDAYGGTGVRADWEAAARLATQRNIVLAGGLHPTNVREAIRTVKPWCVDVSSGVERAGYKDNGLIAAFIDIAKQER